MQAIPAGFAENCEAARFFLVEAGRMQRDEAVLVLAGGSEAGLAAIATAKALGGRVIASLAARSEHQAALDAGADEAIDDDDADWRGRVAAFGGGSGIDMVLDPLGGAHTDRAFRALRPGGRHIVTGFASGEAPKLRTNLPLMKNAAMIGADFSAFRREEPYAAKTNRDAVIALFERGLLRLPRAMVGGDGLEPPTLSV